MRLSPFDPYMPLASPIHRLDARCKLVLALGWIASSALTPAGAWPVYLLHLSFLMAVAVLSHVGTGYVLRRSVISLPFILAALPLLFSLPGQPVWSAGLGPLQFTMTAPGLVRFISLALKSWISVQAAILLTATTSFPALLAALRSLRVPPLLVAIIALMGRYLYVLMDEAVHLLQARAARSSLLPSAPERSAGLRQKPGGSLPWRIKVTGGMVGSLLLRSIERSDRVYQAMLARGYDGDVRTFDLPLMTSNDRVVLGAGLVVLLILMLLGVFFRA